MATLQGAVDELIAVVAAVSGINYAPDDPTEQIPVDPAAVVYATNGYLSGNRASAEDKSLHDIQIAVLMPLVDMALCMKVMLPLYELVVSALITHLNGSTSNHYDTWSSLTYTLGPIDWPQGQLMFGYVFTLGEVKIINEVS